MNLIKGSLNHPIVTIAITLAVVLVGIHAFLTMPRMEDPTITIRTGLVIGVYPGATSEQVAEQLTKKLETQIFSFKEVKKSKTYSTSRPGVVIINVELEDFVKDADVFWAKLRNDFYETRNSLPEGVMSVTVDSNFGDTIAMLIAIHGERYNYRELSDFAETINDRLRKIPQISTISIYGKQQEQFKVTTDSERLSRYSTDPMKIAKILKTRNIVGFSGSFDSPENKVPMQSKGQFKAKSQIEDTVIDVSLETGYPIYLKDVADVTREYADPTFLTRYDSKPSVMISIEMQEGNNIVELGESISKVFTELKSLLPPDLSLDLVADQPTVVKSRINNLSHEFLLAIGSVILVTILLLPFRVAIISAVAIPVTLCATLGIINFFDIALQQVSIAALIMVLGIVVDDAIVIADNYVEQLDRKVPEDVAPWRAVEEVLVAVLTATLTIIASFLPLLILTGSVGEFISSLPKTVTIALTVSFIVATMLTPILCRFFINHGLHVAEDNGKKRHQTVLDLVQKFYAKAIGIFMKRKYLAGVLGVVAVFLGILYYQHVPQQFFPSAERDQFVIDVWMPQGTKFEATDAVMKRLEKTIAENKDVAHYASFVGQSAPRFYYNVNPQQPDTAYGQFIVNTVSEKATVGLVYQFRKTLATVAPEAMVLVKELQQGNLLEAPVEIRISGSDIEKLKEIGEQIEEIVHAVPYSDFVYKDFFNDSMRFEIDINTDTAIRMGFPSEAVAGYLYEGFSGMAATQYMEGERVIPIVLRLNEEYRKDFEDIGNYYVSSPVTGMKIPLRSIADINPEFQTSRLVRRNGVPTLTVRSFVKEGYYASALQEEAAKQVNKLELPAGYYISYGGELENSRQTFPQMLVALSISLVAIFFVLLIQFKNIREPLIVMVSIPLALPGAMLGLFLTNYPFGFTAFMGLISLCGIVVRNSIILVDYIKEKTAEGDPLELACTEAGERRLRPIFLTTMAAAVGVTPMIISGSSLWGPLASVIAIGLICSMFFTLLIIPVLYVVVMSKKPIKQITPSGAAKVIILLSAMFLSASSAVASENFSLKKAVDFALENSRNIKISEAFLQEQKSRQTSAEAYYFPMLKVDSQYTRTTGSGLIQINKGDLGTISGIPLPEKNLKLDQGDKHLWLVSATVTQPVTQLFKISEAVGVADAELAEAQAIHKKNANKIAFAVRQLYFGIMLAKREVLVYSAYVTANEELVREANDAFIAGDVLESKVMEAQAVLLESMQMLISAKTKLSNLAAQFKELLSLPMNQSIELNEDISYEYEVHDINLEEAFRISPEVLAAKQVLEKATRARGAARDEYIPDIGIFAKHTYQDGVAFLDHNITTFGIQAEWNVFDWGKRKGELGARTAQVIQATENLRNAKAKLEVEINRINGKLELAEMSLRTAEKISELSDERLRQMGDRLVAGLISRAVYEHAAAEAVKGVYDLKAAELNLLLTQAELRMVVGLLAP